MVATYQQKRLRDSKNLKVMESNAPQTAFSMESVHDRLLPDEKNPLPCALDAGRQMQDAQEVVVHQIK
jgi:hypothetical protein